MTTGDSILNDQHTHTGEGVRKPQMNTGASGLEHLDILELTGLEVFAHHGVFDFERQNGQTFFVDVQAWLDTSGAAGGDDLGQTVHYGELAEEIVAAVASDPVDLIETLAERVAGVVLAHPPVRQTRVVVHKPDAPITVPFADVSITITRRPALDTATNPRTAPSPRTAPA